MTERQEMFELTSMRKYWWKLGSIHIFRMGSMTQIIVDVVLIVDERLNGVQRHAAMMVHMIGMMMMVMIIRTGSRVMAHIVNIIV